MPYDKRLCPGYLDMQTAEWECDIFFRKKRYQQFADKIWPITYWRELTSIPGRLVRKFPTPVAPGKANLGQETVCQLVTAITPRQWLLAAESCRMCDDQEATLYALGKLEALNDCAWWCCINAMLRAEFLDERNSTTQQKLITRAKRLSRHWLERAFCATTLAAIGAPQEEVEKAVRAATVKGDDYNGIHIEILRESLAAREAPRASFYIHMKYPFHGPWLP